MDTTRAYDRDPGGFAAMWESRAFEEVHAAVLAHLPASPGLVFDIGAGSGRDAARLASMGWSVVAVEPAHGLRELARTRHPSSRIDWLDDSLPGLERLVRRGLVADLIWVSAVWMHVAPAQRRRAFRKLVTLLRPGGRLIMSLRHGPLAFDRPMFETSVPEIERLAIEHGLILRAEQRAADALGRTEVTWTSLVLDLPDDSTGALPLIRGIILDDAKAATYKLALLRVIARIADQSPSLARYHDDHVEVPLGLIALYWLRMYKRMVENDIPQAPGHRSGRGLGFVKKAFWSLTPIAPFELRPGATFDGSRGSGLARAIGDAASTIARMPAHYLTFANNEPIFPTDYAGRRHGRVEPHLFLDEAFFWSFGTTRVPLHLWTAFRRLAAWIEPMLLAQWTRLIAGYAERQGRSIPLDDIATGLRWIDPVRDTRQTRPIAGALIEAGKPVHCVWTGQRLTDAAKLEIDHCFPFAAWPCDDMWNLMPSSRGANNAKRDRLVTLELLERSKDRIAQWWAQAYRDPAHVERSRRFALEARSSLPIEGVSETLEPGHGPGLAFAPSEPFRHEREQVALSDEAIFDAMRYQRIRLRQDQNLGEWNG